MWFVSSILIDGFVYGMVLFIIAVGLSVTMGLMRVVNLAHGGFALIGGATAHWLAFRHGVDYWAAAALSILLTMMIAAAAEISLYRRIYAMEELQQVLATIGIAFIITATVNFLFGSTILAIPLPQSLQDPVDLGFRILPAHRLLVILVGLGVLGLLHLLVDRTRFGVSLRAAVDNRQAAAGIGIDTGRIFAITFVTGSGLAALGGILGAEMMPIEASYPLRYIVLVLIVTIVGGMGSVNGTFLAALGLGIIDTAARYMLSEYGTIIFYAAMMVIVLLRREGAGERAAA